MVKAPTEGIKNSKPRFKSAREELPQLSREYLIHRNEQMRNKNLTAQMELAVRRGQLISKDLAVKQGQFLMISLRQKLLHLSSHAHKLVGLDANAMRKALREIAVSILNEVRDLPSAVTDLTNAYARLVAQRTWLKLRETLDQDRGLMAALQQYMAAIRGIGAGTGVRAVRYRQDARRAMIKANRAIRCWIMPHWRVSESLPSELALFDLVIVDEASQSDLWALPALLRAKKLLIVGDNKKVSPAAVGVRESDIRQLHSRFLRALPFGDVLTPEKSIYDLAGVMFASDLIRLREHFRCVEPIIEFSNRLCYNSEIRCLRVPTAAQRITPPLVDVFVRGGYRDSRSTKINRVEACAIVDEITRLTNDPAFADRTIGVVSLQDDVKIGEGAVGSYEKAPPEHRVDLPNPDVDTVSFGLRIVFHDGASLSKE